jgi:hypothetical protein
MLTSKFFRGLMTPFSSGAGCKDFMPRKAVMPSSSAATADSASIVSGTVGRTGFSRRFRACDQVGE